MAFFVIVTFVSLLMRREGREVVVNDKPSMTPSSSPPHEGEKRGENQKPKKTLNKYELISIAFQMGFIIAIPVVVFGFLGKWLDARAGTEPILTLIGMFTAIVFTSIWIYRKFKSYFK